LREGWTPEAKPVPELDGLLGQGTPVKATYPLFFSMRNVNNAIK
jgi:hypothetical protein